MCAIFSTEVYKIFNLQPHVTHLSADQLFFDISKVKESIFYIRLKNAPSQSFDAPLVENPSWKLLIMTSAKHLFTKQAMSQRSSALLCVTGRLRLIYDLSIIFYLSGSSTNMVAAFSRLYILYYLTSGAYNQFLQSRDHMVRSSISISSKSLYQNSHFNYWIRRYFFFIIS